VTGAGLATVTTASLAANLAARAEPLTGDAVMIKPDYTLD
jgi:hypothetical protein